MNIITILISLSRGRNIHLEKKLLQNIRFSLIKPMWESMLFALKIFLRERSEEISNLIYPIIRCKDSGVTLTKDN